MKFYLDYSPSKHGVEFSLHCLNHEMMQTIYDALRDRFKNLERSGKTETNEAMRIHLLVKEIEKNHFTQNTGRTIVSHNGKSADEKIIPLSFYSQKIQL